MENKFESPRTEALEIALGIRRKLLEGKEDIISVLRNCLVVATNLGMQEDISWIKNELEGHFIQIPSYREVSCPKLSRPDELVNCKIPFEIKVLYDLSAKNQDIRYSDKAVTIRPLDARRIIDRVTNKCLFFLNRCIPELQYGGYVQSVFESIREEVDRRVKDLDQRINQELQSAYTNLKSNNPSDYPKVALSCRKILKFVADKLFPPQEHKHKTKDGREWEVKENNFRNRIICFIDKNSNHKTSKSECEMIERYMRDIVGDAQDGVHEDLSLNQASLLAIHTYLILADLLAIESRKT